MTDVSTFLELMDAYGNRKVKSKSLQSEKHGSQTTSLNYQPRFNTFNGILLGNCDVFLTYLHVGHQVSGFPQRITIVGQGKPWKNTTRKMKSVSFCICFKLGYPNNNCGCLSPGVFIVKGVWDLAIVPPKKIPQKWIITIFLGLYLTSTFLT